MPRYIRLAEIVLAAVLAAILFFSWREDRRDRAQLATQLAAAQQSLAAAESRQQDRDSQLQQTLAAINAQKSAALTPAQILAQLPRELALPVPLTLQSASGAGVTPPHGATAAPQSASASSSASDTGNIAAPMHASSDQSPQRTATPPNGKTPPNISPDTPPANQVILPSQDLKPLYDFALDCKACQARLAASQADLADEKTKTVSLTRERDAALHAAKGGSLLRRVARAAKWFAIGAAAGALAAKAAR